MTQTHTLIRPAIRADAAGIAEMANELNVFVGAPGDVYSGKLVEAHAFRAAPLFSAVVAEAGGELVGYAFFHDCFNTEIAAPGIWLHDLFVRKHARRGGTGRRLMAAVARAAVERGATTLWWGVESTNRQARTFYTGLGAKDEDARIFELDGEALTGLAQAARE